MLNRLWRRWLNFWQGGKAKPAKIKLFPIVIADAIAPAAGTGAELAVVVPQVAVSKPVTATSLISARIRSVARINKKKTRVGAASRLKSKAKSVKRSPPLYPVKSKKIVPKRAKTRVLVQKPRKSAVILRFPARPQRSVAVRQRRVA